jgi:hypothetical protein
MKRPYFTIFGLWLAWAIILESVAGSGLKG